MIIAATAKSSSESSIGFIRPSAILTIILLFLFSTLLFYSATQYSRSISSNTYTPPSTLPPKSVTSLNRTLRQTSISAVDKQIQEGSNFLIANKIIRLFGLIFRILNANTTIVPLNEVTQSFDTLLNSQGWRAIDTLINTVGNSLTIYDALDGAVERADGRRRNREEDSDTSENDFQEKVTDSLKELVAQMMAINLELKCLSITNKENRPTECSNSNKIMTVQRTRKKYTKL